MEQHIFWQDRYKVALLMEDFLNKKIDGEELCDQVYGLRSRLVETYKQFRLELTSDSEKIKAFQPDEKAKKLRGFLTTVYCECEHFDDDYENEELYTFIEYVFLKFQKILNEE